MSINYFIELLGGLALFLYGMAMMSKGLELAAGDKLRVIIEKMTSNFFKAILVGAIVTAIIQSSSATTVMVVGFVNAGLMNIYPVSYTHLTLPTIAAECRSRWSTYH